MTPPLAPMLPVAGLLPAGGGWLFEPKWDGIRALVDVGEDGVATIRSRPGRDITADFPEVADHAGKLARPVLLDGEIVVEGADGRPDFDAVRSRLVSRRGVTTPATFVAFDVLALDGDPLLRRPQAERRRVLEALELSGPAWRISIVSSNGEALWEVTRDFGLEGVVAKRADAVYRPGARTRSWLKAKHRYRSDVEVVGYTTSAPRPRLVLAAPGGDGPVYAGTVELGVGAEHVAAVSGRGRDGRGDFRLRGVRWIDPLVATVEHGPPTAAGRLREPVLRSLSDRGRAVALPAVKGWGDPPA